MTVWYTTQQ